MAVGHLLVVLAVADPVAVNLVEVSLVASQAAVNPVEENLAEVDPVVKNRVL